MKLNLLPRHASGHPILMKKWWARQWRISRIGRFFDKVQESVVFKCLCFLFAVTMLVAIVAIPNTFAWNWAIVQMGLKPIGYIQVGAVIYAIFFSLYLGLGILSEGGGKRY